MTDKLGNGIIEEHDTVKIDGLRFKAVVEEAYDNGKVRVSQVWTIRNTTRTEVFDVDADRLTLVRKGNRDRDMELAVCAWLDAKAAYEAGTGPKEAYTEAYAHYNSLCAK